MTTVCYLRQSLARHDDELAVSRQLKECKRVAKQRGIAINDVLTDNNYSASKRGRPAYDRLIQSIDSGAVTRVIILRVDRLLRLNDELEELIKLVEVRGLSVVTCEGEIDLSTPQGRLIARILVSVARSEVEVKSARHKLANDQRAEAGLPHAGRRAYGYETDGMTLREDEALVLKDIGHKFANGWSLTQIAAWMNAQGYRTTMGNKFHGIALRNMLQRKRYAGIRTHDGVDYPAQWTGVWDADLWDRIQYQMRLRSEASNLPIARRCLLTGLLWCGNCGASMNGTTTYNRKTGEPRKAYRCNRNRLTPDGQPGCGAVTRGAVPLDWWIKELICRRLDSPELADMLDSDDTNVNELIHRRTSLDDKIARLLVDYYDETITKAEYKQSKQRALAEASAIDGQIAANSSTREFEGLLSSGESVRRRWETETDGWRIKLATLLIERIDVNGSRKLPRIDIDGKRYYFNSEAIDVRWKA